MKRFIFILSIFLSVFTTSCEDTIQENDFNVPNEIIMEAKLKQIDFVKDSTFTDTLISVKSKDSINLYDIKITKNDIDFVRVITTRAVDPGIFAVMIIVAILSFVGFLINS